MHRHWISGGYGNHTHTHTHCQIVLDLICHPSEHQNRQSKKIDIRDDKVIVHEHDCRVVVI